MDIHEKTGREMMNSKHSIPEYITDMEDCLHQLEMKVRRYEGLTKVEKAHVKIMISYFEEERVDVKLHCTVDTVEETEAQIDQLDQLLNRSRTLLLDPYVDTAISLKIDRDHDILAGVVGFIAIAIAIVVFL